jgi:hypothetical protein
MPPSGGIVVFVAAFSTADVDALRISLWTSRTARFADKDLARGGDILRIRDAGFARFPQRLWNESGQACG